MTTNETLSIIAGAIVVGSMWPYIRDTLRGKTKPNAVTWFTWTLLTGIATVVSFSEGAITTAIFSLSATMATGSIVVLALKNGVKHYTRFDITCQLTALLGIVVWQMAGRADLAIIIVVAVDAVAALPTLRHAWLEPHAETWTTFAWGVLSAFIALFTITQFTVVAWAYPIWILFANALIAATILYRRTKVKGEK